MGNELTAPKPTPIRTEPVEVDVAIEALPEPTVTDDQALEAFKRSGLTLVTAETVRDLAAVGVYAKGVGVLRIQRGRAMFTQQRLEEAMRLLSSHMHTVHADPKLKTSAKTNNLVRSAGALSSLARQTTESQRLATDIESLTTQSGAPVADTPNNVPSFAPKQKVGPSTSPEIHNHGPVQIVVGEKK